MKKVLFAAVALLATALTGVVTVGSDAGSDTRPTRYVVVYDLNASPAVARGAVARAGGRVVRENVKVGVATAISSRHDFLAKASRESALAGVARNKPLGSVGKPAFRKFSAKQLKAQIRAGKGLRPLRHAGTYLGGPGQHEPLAAKQWDMRMINATPEGSYSKERGDKKVLVGVLDTGVDASHPDIAPNFNRALSRNFTVDIPSAGGFVIDGPCEVEPDHSCTDPADVDENLHGTHVASTIAAPINKLGIAGVAPDVSIVNLRAGQDSGYFFLQPSVDALTFAADHGIDVVNMSYFIDPWWMNCVNNPADDSTEQLEQRTIIAATQRALDYAHLHGVTMIAAEGNEHADLGHPTGDTISPDFPDDSVKSPPRPVDNSCMILPTEGNHVMSVSSLGPLERKADYSNYGLEQTTVSAPGGWFREDPWQPTLPAAERTRLGTPNQILAALPEFVARTTPGLLNPDGTPATLSVERDCAAGACGYYIWIQGTSMASPHAVGVAALIISKYGDKRGGGIAMDPDAVEAMLTSTARDHACPEPRLFTYINKGRDAAFNALCEGDAEFNGFYGHGIVDALAAVSTPRGLGK